MTWPRIHTLFLAVLLLICCTVAHADTDNYPDFVGSAPVPAMPAPPEDEIPAYVEAADSPTTPTTFLSPDEGVTMIGDSLTTETWHATRERLLSNMETLRVLSLQQVERDALERHREVLQDDLDRLLLMAPYQAPNFADAMQWQGTRVMRLLDNFVRDASINDPRQLAVTDRLLRGSTDEWVQILIQADLERGDSSDRLVRLPDDWSPGAFSSEDFATQIKGWDPSRLISSYRSRHQDVQRRLRGREEDDIDPLVFLEMGELARELASRAWQLPTASQVPFRNATLRLDVLAENLSEYTQESNRLYARRQLRVMATAIRDCEAFLQKNITTNQ